MTNLGPTNWMGRALEIAREVFAGHPSVGDDDWLGYLIWNETGFPCFFDGDPQTELRKQLEAIREGMAHRDSNQ